MRGRKSLPRWLVNGIRVVFTDGHILSIAAVDIASGRPELQINVFIDYRLAIMKLIYAGFSREPESFSKLNKN